MWEGFLFHMHDLTTEAHPNLTIAERAAVRLYKVVYQRFYPPAGDDS